MPIRVDNLRLSIDEPEAALPGAWPTCWAWRPAGRCAGASSASRSTPAPRPPCSSSTPPRSTLPEDEALVARPRRASARPPIRDRLSTPKSRSSCRRPGRPRCGIGPWSSAPAPAAWWRPTSSPQQGYRPLVLERGRAVRDRIHDVRAFDAGGPFDPESNYLFGEGGAGTFSDGKLTCRSSGPDVRRVLELFAECKGKPSILYDARPHLGSNRLPAVVKAIRRAHRGAGRRGALLLPRRGPRPARRPAARPDDLVGLRPGRRWCCWRSATAPATPTPCCCAAACRWCRSRFRWACASSSRRRRQPRQVRPDPAGGTPGRRRLHAGRARPARPVHASACAPAATSCPACPSRATSAPTA